MTLRSRNRLVGTVVAVSCVFGATACGSGSKSDESKPSSTPTKTEKPVQPSSSADPQVAEKAAVMDVYDAMTREQAKAYQKADEKGTDLQKYATLDALGKIRIDLVHMKESGTVVRGAVEHDAKVTSLDLKAKTPKATLSDCVDLSRYETYDLKAKKVIPLPSEQPLRYVATAKAERWDGRWMVTDIDRQGGPTC